MDKRRQMARGPRSGAAPTTEIIFQMPPENHRVVDIEYSAGGTMAQLRVTLLAAGFVIGARGASARQIGQVTGAVVQSWTETAQGDGEGMRVFRVQGKKGVVQAAVTMIQQAVQKYKDLCDSKRRGEFVQREHVIGGVQFHYQPPPRKAMVPVIIDRSQGKAAVVQVLAGSPQAQTLQNLQQSLLAAHQQATSSQPRPSLQQQRPPQLQLPAHLFLQAMQAGQQAPAQMRPQHAWQHSPSGPLPAFPTTSAMDAFTSTLDHLQMLSLEQAMQQHSLADRLFPQPASGTAVLASEDKGRVDRELDSTGAKAWVGAGVKKGTSLPPDQHWNGGGYSMFSEHQGQPTSASPQPKVARSQPLHEGPVGNGYNASRFSFANMTSNSNSSSTGMPYGTAHPGGRAEEPEDTLCIVCLERPPGVCLLTCGHSAFCLPCVQGLSNCPLCREEIVTVQPAMQRPAAFDLGGGNGSSFYNWATATGM